MIVAQHLMRVFSILLGRLAQLSNAAGSIAAGSILRDRERSRHEAKDTIHKSA